MHFKPILRGFQTGGDLERACIHLYLYLYPLPMPTAKAVLRADKTNRQGTAPVYLRLADRDRSLFTSLGVRVRPADWNPRVGAVRKSHPQAPEINALISGLGCLYRPRC